jgi:hypothetical protein
MSDEMKPASLAEERLYDLGKKCQLEIQGYGGVARDRAETTLALLAERAEMLRMLETARDKLNGFYRMHPDCSQLADTITTFLATRTAGKETG